MTVQDILDDNDLIDSLYTATTSYVLIMTGGAPSHVITSAMQARDEAWEALQTRMASLRQPNTETDE